MSWAFAAAAGLIVLGLALQFAEFFIPSFGAITVCALIVLGLGVYVAFGQNIAFGYIALGATAVLWVVDIAFGARFLRRSPLVLKESEAGFQSREAPHLNLVGREGQVHTVLKPSGKVRVGEELYDAVSETVVLERDTRVRVTGVRGDQLVVRPIRNV